MKLVWLTKIGELKLPPYASKAQTLREQQNQGRDQISLFLESSIGRTQVLAPSFLSPLTLFFSNLTFLSSASPFYLVLAWPHSAGCRTPPPSCRVSLALIVGLGRRRRLSLQSDQLSCYQICRNRKLWKVRNKLLVLRGRVICVD